MARVLYIPDAGEKSKANPLKAQYDQSLGVNPADSELVYWPELIADETLSERESLIISTLHRRAADIRDLNASFVHALLSGVFNATKHEAIIALISSKITNDTISIVSHGIGSLFALETLNSRTNVLPLFITMGSPLGADVVQKHLISRYSALRVPSCITKWVNFTDRKDPISKDGTLNDDFQDERITDCLVVNAMNRASAVSTAQKAHNVFGYLRLPQIQSLVREALK